MIIEYLYFLDSFPPGVSTTNEESSVQYYPESKNPQYYDATGKYYCMEI